MNNKNRTPWIAAGLVLFCGFFVFAVVLVYGLSRMTRPTTEPTVDLFATLSASTPLSTFSPAPAMPTATSPFDFSEPTLPVVPTAAGLTAVPTVSSQDRPIGHIVFTCQVYKYQSADQICIMNADGTGYRRLTTDDDVRHYYPSLSPNGRKVLYSAFRQENVYEIY